MPAMSDWITVREAAQVLGVHVSAIPKMLRRGDLARREQRPILDRAQVLKYRDARQAAQAVVRQDSPRGPVPPDSDHDWLSSAEAAAVMGITPTGVNVRARRGRLPSVLANGRRWYRRDHLELVQRADQAKRRRTL